MRNIDDLIRKLSGEEEKFRQTRFLAPCVAGGRVQTRVAAIVQIFKPQPANFTGWGVFRAVGDGLAELIEEAPLPRIAEYLRLFPALRMILAAPLSGMTWLAYPANEGDMRQRWAAARPEAVHLVSEGALFDGIVARDTGGGWFFDETDRRSNPRNAARLRDSLTDLVLPADVKFAGLTPEMRAAYELATQRDETYRGRVRDAAAARWSSDLARLDEALQTGGGALEEATDRGDYWLVTWTTSDGERHTSAIGKGDLTVVSSGICLSGLDSTFDLQSLVPVIERRDTDW